MFSITFFSILGSNPFEPQTYVYMYIYIYIDIFIYTQLDNVRYDITWYNMMGYDIIWYNMIQYDTIQIDSMIWYDMM